MNAYVVIYVAGMIGATVGPLPYGKDQCEFRVKEILETSGPNVVTVDGYSAKDIKIACEYHKKRPKLNFKPKING